MTQKHWRFYEASTCQNTSLKTALINSSEIFLRQVIFLLRPWLWKLRENFLKAQKHPFGIFSHSEFLFTEQNQCFFKKIFSSPQRWTGELRTWCRNQASNFGGASAGQAAESIILKIFRLFRTLKVSLKNEQLLQLSNYQDFDTKIKLKEFLIQWPSKKATHRAIWSFHIIFLLSMCVSFTWELHWKDFESVVPMKHEFERRVEFKIKTFFINSALSCIV